ncbi:MAG TPA: hypothetical protein VGG45_02625 [Terracidiphilus sp.]|jgi:hypothetical protein
MRAKRDDAYFSFISDPSGSSSLKAMVRIRSATGNTTGYTEPPRRVAPHVLFKVHYTK